MVSQGTSRATVAVIGGGIAGLAAAWRLSAGPDQPRVVLYESAQRLGGKIRSATLDGATVETGPDGFVGQGSVLAEICAALGLGDDLVAARNASVHVYSRGRLRTLPSGLVMGLPVSAGPVLRSGLLTYRDLARAGVDLVAPRSKLDHDVSIADLVGRRMGRAVVDRLVEPLLGGVYAGSAESLGVDEVLPGLRERVNRHRSLVLALRKGGTGAGSRGLVTVRGGLTRLVEALGDELGRRGVEVHTGAEVSALNRAGAGWRIDLAGGGGLDAAAVVLAAPAGAAARLIGPAVPAAAALGGVPYASLAVTLLRYPKAAVPAGVLTSNGVLVPRGEGLLLRACTWVTSKWPHIDGAGTVIVRCSAGSHGDERIAALDDGALVAALDRELHRIAGISAAPVDSLVTRWPEALPQYRAGHRDLVAAARAGLPAGLVLAGAGYDGVGLSTCADQGRAAAEAVLGSLAGETPGVATAEPLQPGVSR